MFWSPFYSLLFLSAILNSSLADFDRCKSNCYKSSARNLDTVPPVFTPFTDDGKLNLSKIPEIARFFCKNEISGVIVNAAEGDGNILTLEEKKMLLDAWIKASKICNLGIIVKLGPFNYQILRQFAMYVATKKDNIVAVEITAGDIETNSTAGVIKFASMIAKIVYPIPIMYYDTSIDKNNFNMAEIFKTLKKYIKNFGGMKTDFLSSLEVRSRNQLNSNLRLFSDSSYDITGPYAYCINGTSTQIANIFPDIVTKIKKSIQNGELGLAIHLQLIINSILGSCFELLRIEVVSSTALFYAEQVYREIFRIRTGIDAGYARYPYPMLPEKIKTQCAARVNALLKKYNI